MNKNHVFALLLTLALALAAGFWLGTRHAAVNGKVAVARKPLFYRHPMNPKVTSQTPAKDEMGMDYVPVYAEDLAPAGAEGGKGRILYYRHPMGAADTSPVPKKDEMGMDYIPVYEGEGSPSRQIHISPEKVQKLGVKSARVERRKLVRSIRALGTIQADERRLHAVTTKFEGWVQRLHVGTTGQAVRRGQPLLDVYSPDLLTVQQEYLIARKGLAALQNASPQARKTAEQVVQNALQRLRYWDIGATELRKLQDADAPLESMPLLSPASGVVLEKPAVAGMRFMPGELLFRIADLSTVWLLANVYEQDLSWIGVGQEVSAKMDADPDRQFAGRIDFIYPTLASETRTVQVRVELSNGDGFLKPGLYGSIVLAASGRDEESVTVPDSAVLDSGTRQVVLVQLGEGLFEPRTVKVGRQADDYLEILDGLTPGESVVTSANFLIDAESNLKAALDAMETRPPKQVPEPPPSGPVEGGEHHHGSH